VIGDPNYQPPADEKRPSKYIRDLLTVFNILGTRRVAHGVRIIAAAVTYAAMDTPEPQAFPEISDLTIPHPAIRESLLAAQFFHGLQEDSQRVNQIADCVKTMSLMVNRLHAILEGIASFRALFLHAAVVNQSPEDKRAGMEEEYDRLTKTIKAGVIAHEVVGALGAFLTSGVKGLMIYPSDNARYGPVKLSHFIVLCDKLHQAEKIEEPVWKYTQKLILDTIETSLFPQGFEQARKDLGSGICDEKWEHSSLSKFRLAKAIEVDFYNFCKNRSSFPGGESYSDPPFELPDIPAARPPKTHRTQSIIPPPEE